MCDLDVDRTCPVTGPTPRGVCGISLPQETGAHGVEADRSAESVSEEDEPVGVSNKTAGRHIYRIPTSFAAIAHNVDIETAAVEARCDRRDHSHCRVLTVLCKIAAARIRRR